MSIFCVDEYVFVKEGMTKVYRVQSATWALVQLPLANTNLMGPVSLIDFVIVKVLEFFNFRLITTDLPKLGN